MELMTDRNEDLSLMEKGRKVMKWPDTPRSMSESGQIGTIPTQTSSSEPSQSKRVNNLHISTDTNSADHTTIPSHNPRLPTSAVAETLNSPFSQRRWLKRFAFPKSHWPEPELSIGTRCNRMGPNECWEAIGPAKDLFVQIAQSVGRLLDDRMDELEEGEPVTVDFLIFGMYMIGKRPSSAQPTLVFTCQRQIPRRRAIKFIKESSILKGHPEIKLAESSVPPITTRDNLPRFLAGNNGLLQTGKNVAGMITLEDMQTSSGPSEESAALNVLGVPIICGSTGRRATIGGIVLIGGKHYGLTVAHLFVNLSSTLVSTRLDSTTKVQDGDPEFAFDDWEDETHSEVDEADVIITSGGSASFVASTALSRSNTTTTISSRLQPDNRSIDIEAPVPDDVFLDTEENSLSTPEFRAPLRLGELFMSSILASQLGHDWGLVALTEEGIKVVRNTSSKNLLHQNIIFPQRFIRNLDREASIVAINGYSGISRGSISSSPTMMRLSHSNRFQEVWTVRLDNSLVEGDSGSWIIDAVSGDLYGHTVVGLLDGHIAYIIPAYKIFEDIERLLGPVEFASMAQLSKATSDEIQLATSFNQAVSSETQNPNLQFFQLPEVTPAGAFKPGRRKRTKIIAGQDPHGEDDFASADEDSGYSTHGLSSARANLTTMPSLTRLQTPGEIHLRAFRAPNPMPLLISDSESSEDYYEGVYIRQSLPPSSLDNEELVQHLKTHAFGGDIGHTLLSSIRLRERRLTWPSLCEIMSDEEDDDKQRPEFQVLKVDATGVPTRERREDGVPTSAQLWNAIKALNSDLDSFENVVGRRIIVQQPSPLMFGSLHLAMNDVFDMDEVLQILDRGNDKNATMARPFSSDERQQSSFVFSFHYFHVIGHGCNPLSWQHSDYATKKAEHIPLSYCSSVVALSLSGPPARRIRQKMKTGKRAVGSVYDLWSPWQVMTIKCYADHVGSSAIEHPSMRFLNGPDVFLESLFREFCDAHERFTDIHTRIVALVIHDDEILFNGDLRDKLLFEDENFTWSRRYFWAYQTLGIMNDNIRTLVDSYQETFDNNFWAGRHQSIWPVLEKDTARAIQWSKRLTSWRKQFDEVMHQLEAVHDKGNLARSKIREMRDELFNGTSVMESRKSIELTATTTLQARNIKLLTLITIFFLPITFISSVFSMSGMPTRYDLDRFFIVAFAVCIPLFLLLGSLNTTMGLNYWKSIFERISSIISFIEKSVPAKTLEVQEEVIELGPPGLRIRRKFGPASSGPSAQKKQEAKARKPRIFTA